MDDYARISYATDDRAWYHADYYDVVNWCPTDQSGVRTSRSITSSRMRDFCLLHDSERVITVEGEEMMDELRSIECLL